MQIFPVLLASLFCFGPVRLSVVIDHAVKRAEGDGERLAAYGISGGGALRRLPSTTGA